MNRYLPVLIIPFIVSCAASKNYNPNKKFAPHELQQDYQLLQNIFETKHPALYWYTSKDSMDENFMKGYRAINDSMTELQFGWNVLAPLTSTIHCGHTSFSMSKDWNRFIKDKRIPSFPLYLKVWRDSMMVMGNLNRHDTLIKRGDFITAINGVKSADIISRMFDYMVEDGYANNVNYIRLSSSFPYFHRNIFGLYKNYTVNYSDSNNVAKSAIIPFFAPSPDSVRKEKKVRNVERRKITRGEKMENMRSLQVDTSYALMTLNTFSKGHLSNFLNRSFKKIKKDNVQNLVIDLRANGGGDIIKSVLLTKYLRNSPFKVADTAYAISRTLKPYTRYISKGFWDNIGLLFVTHKKKDGNYHFGYWERHIFKPKRRNHFDGKVFVLVNGLTFSASTLFCNAVKGQSNITLVGEETGGGWYGNSGILISQVTLPHTGLKVRLPLFKLVQYDHISRKGTGVIPDIYVGTDWRDLLNRVDTKMEKVIQMIEKK